MLETSLRIGLPVHRNEVRTLISAVYQTWCELWQRFHKRSQRGLGGLGTKESGKNLHNLLAVQKGQIFYVKVLCLVIASVNMTKYMPQKCQICQICGYQVCFLKL